MSNPFPTQTDVNLWTYFTLGGVPSPGSIARGGVKGFARKTGWDIKSGKGAKGATLTLKDQPPCEGTITLQLIGPGGFYAYLGPSRDFALWDTFVSLVLSQPTAQQQAQGLPIYYPGFASIGLTDVVVKNYTGPEHVGRGLYECKIDLIEWTPPPAASVVATVTAAKPDSGADSPAAPQQSARNQALQSQINAANHAAGT